MTAIRIVLVDDNIWYRASLAALLAQWPYVCVVAETDNGAQALEMAAQLRPDLLLVDVVMPEMSGIELTCRLKALCHPPRVLVLTMHALPGYRAAALEAGADDFLAKDQVIVTLAPTIYQLFPGRSPGDRTCVDGAANNALRGEPI